jgi:GNAT superfamily N-acetyltransferase
VKVHEQQHNFDLPSGLSIVVRQLRPEDSHGTQRVMAGAWDETYVAPGLMTTDQRRQYTDSDSPERIEFISERISKARAQLAAETRGAALFLGAFTVGDQAEQIGMLKYSEEVGTTPGAKSLDMYEGDIGEVDVLPGWTRMGVGSAMFAVALRHAVESGHYLFGLQVVRHNARATSFYAQRLGMVMGEAVPRISGMPAAMDRVEMRGLVKKSLAKLQASRPWLQNAA